MKRFTTPLIALTAGAAGLLGSHPAQAHGGAASGVLGGLTHPLLGLDHLLILLAVGAAASVLSTRLLLWAALGALAGATAGAWGVQLPAAEVWAALAVAAMGGLTLVVTRAAASALTALRRDGLDSWFGLVVAGGVAIHALLHGQEAPADGATLLWWSGALISSVVVCGGAYRLFKHLPVAFTKAGAVLFLALGGALAFAPLPLLVGGAGG
ncbi:MAG: HupE/UreJ family protein [Cyanobacteriota bacterium]|nr:HupE/UreJ family protein [Cyanobacteriota bacterium]